MIFSVFDNGSDPYVSYGGTVVLTSFKSFLQLLGIDEVRWSSLAVSQREMVILSFEGARDLVNSF